MKPFQKVTRSIENISDGYLDESISVPDYLETELITDAFNKMLTRVRTLDDSRQEFVSNVSHELKTPLASMKVLADSLNGQEGVPVELLSGVHAGYYLGDRRRKPDYYRPFVAGQDG